MPSKPQSPTHTMFIDDSGTKEYASENKYDQGNTRHFVFGGFTISVDDIYTLDSKVKELKKSVFGTGSVEIKSNWLRMPGERKKRYLEPYGISEEELSQFVENLYEIVNETNLTFMASVIDKIHMMEDYGPRPWYAPDVAYEVLLQRVQQHMEETGGYAQIIIDDMTGATPKKNQYKTNLDRYHKRLLKYGSHLKRGMVFDHIIGRLIFKPSHLHHTLQIADLCSYNVLRQFRDHGEEWEGENEKLVVYGYLDKIALKFRRDDGNRIQGYGIVKFPLRKRKRWAVPA